MTADHLCMICLNTVDHYRSPNTNPSHNPNLNHSSAVICGGRPWYPSATPFFLTYTNTVWRRVMTHSACAEGRASLVFPYFRTCWQALIFCWSKATVLLTFRLSSLYLFRHLLFLFYAMSHGVFCSAHWRLFSPCLTMPRRSNCPSTYLFCCLLPLLSEHFHLLCTDDNRIWGLRS